MKKNINWRIGMEEETMNINPELLEQIGRLRYSENKTKHLELVKGLELELGPSIDELYKL